MRKLRAIISFALVFALIFVAIPISGVRAQETLIWEASVQSNGTPVTSPVLEAGRQYRIVATGAFISCDPISGWVIVAADAYYYTDEFFGTFPTAEEYWIWTTPLSLPGGHSFLQIDGSDVNWGPFNNGEPGWNGHVYTYFHTGTGAAIVFTIMDWIDGNYSHNFCHLDVQIWEGPPPPPEAETAYAYGGSYATCFKHWGFKNWGWSNGPLGSGFYTFDIYAGAAKCNINKGTLVGTLTVDYDGSTAIVTYLMNAGWSMMNTQLYVGSEPLPRDGKGDYTTAPGQYPYKHPGIDAASDTFTVSGLSGNIYVVAHADVFEV